LNSRPSSTSTTNLQQAKTFIDTTQPHLLDLTQELTSLPPALPISLSAHHALSLAATFEHNKDLHDSLISLSSSLTAVSDSLSALNIHGYYTCKSLARLLKTSADAGRPGDFLGEMDPYLEEMEKRVYWLLEKVGVSQAEVRTFF
jgi:hypothetical protein